MDERWTNDGSKRVVTLRTGDHKVGMSGVVGRMIRN